MIAQGPKVKEFEKKFADLCGVEYAVALNSGTAALHTSLYALGVKPGDEVITVPFTFVATANSILMQGAKPVFVDVDDRTFNIDASLIEEKITDKTKAILGVHLYGQPFDLGKVQKIAKKHNLKVIEDCAQAVEAKYDNKVVGSIGDVGTFSFYATKNLITGEGGILTTNDRQIAELGRRFRHHGQSESTKYEYWDLGYNYRMMDIQAALGIAQLEKIEEITAKRISNAKKLSEGLKMCDNIEIPYIEKNREHVFHLYTIKTQIRAKIMENLKKNNIGCGVYYPKPLHLHPFFKKLGYEEGDFPVSEQLSKEVLSLPVHPLVKDADIDKIIKTLGNI